MFCIFCSCYHILHIIPSFWQSYGSIEIICLCIYFHAGLRLWLSFLNLWRPANKRSQKKGTLVYCGTRHLLKWEGNLRPWKFTSRTHSSYLLRGAGWRQNAVKRKGKVIENGPFEYVAKESSWSFVLDF
jgi:hypothetical protein